MRTLTKKQKFKLFETVVRTYVDKFGLNMWALDFVMEEELEAAAALQYYTDGNRRCSFLFNPEHSETRKDVEFAALHEFGHFLSIEFTSMITQIRDMGAHVTELEIVKMEEGFANIIANGLMNKR